MPSIFLPDRHIVQPQDRAETVERSWLTYLPSLGINSPINGKTLSNVGVLSAAGYSGVAANIADAGDYLQFTTSENTPDAFHLVSVFDIDASSTFSRLFECESSSGDPRFTIWFAPSTSSGTNGNASSVVIVRNVTGGTSSGERWSSPANSLVRPRSGVVLEVLWNATTSDTTTPQVWINGVAQTMTKVQSSSPSSTSFASLSGVALRIGNRFGTIDRGMLGKLYLLHIEQQARVTPYINPWQIFRASPRRLYFDIPSSGGITGTLSATETGPDISSISGIVLVQGNLFTTETTADSFSGEGIVLVSGSVAATESTVDTFTASGSTSGAISGSLNATETTVDVFASSGTILVSGSLTTTESTSDIVSISGDVFISGTLAATEGTSDVFFATNVAPAANKTVNSKWLVSLGSSGGTVQLQMASEVNGVNVTLQDGLLFLKYRKI